MQVQSKRFVLLHFTHVPSPILMLTQVSLEGKKSRQLLSKVTEYQSFSPGLHV